MRMVAEPHLTLGDEAPSPYQNQISPPIQPRTTRSR